MSDYKNLRLDQQLCFALYSATHAVTRTYREHLSKIGLTYPQYLVLLVLWQENQQTVKSLADKLNLDSATLTPLLKRLASAGFVTRERGSIDEREVFIALTEVGYNLKDTVCQIQQNVSVETGLSEFEYFQLRNKLHHLLDAMQVGQQKKPNLLERLGNGN